jgi:hypothetical protein
MFRLALIAFVLVAAGCDDNRTPAVAPADGGDFACLPDLDGRLTADELPLALGRAVRYYASPAGATRAVDLAGREEGGALAWDLSEERADDAIVSATAEPLAAQWYADEVVGGDFVIAEPDGLDQIFARDDDALSLVAIASHDPAPAAGRTLLVYRAPVAVLRLPLVDGDRHTETGELDDGELLGLPYVGSDTYEVEVAGVGELHLPYVRFDSALRVRTRVVSTPAVGGGSTSVRQTGFWFECAGEVARARSQPGEPDPDFTTAAALRRLAL